MRAIIIQDKDAKALVDKLKLESLEGTDHAFRGAVQHLDLLDKLTPFERDTLLGALVSGIHSSFHYHVVRWLQEQGAQIP